MTETQATLTRRNLKTPRAAAIAGILVAVLYGASLVFIRISIPADPAVDSAAWLETNATTIAMALVLLLSIGYSLWVILIFPGWVLAVSAYFLILVIRRPFQESLSEV